jgi:hypothetical protein
LDEIAHRVGREVPKLGNRRPSHAIVVAYLALFVALGGSSYAAIKITGKNVKDSSLTGKDVKNSSLTTSDVKNRSLLAKDFKRGQLQRGPAGPAGPTGAKGDAGTSVFSSSVPSGTTVRGSWGIAGDAGPDKFLEVGVSLPVPAPAPMEDVKMGGGPEALNPDPSCTGTVHQPSAPRGKVCVYELPDASNVASPGVDATPMDGNATSQSDRFGFLVNLTATDSAHFAEAYGTWAYTAP